MIYSCNNQDFTIIKGINLFYIFILENIFEFEYQKWFHIFMEFIKFSTNFIILNLI
jgi:hypothetical protein